MIPKHVYESSLQTFFAPIRPYLQDESVTEVVINGPREIFFERKGRMTRADAEFSSPDQLHSALRVVAQYVGRAFDEAHPILEGRLPDGSRIEALLPPIAPDGPSVSIRRFSKDKLTMKKLVSLGALSQDAVDLLAALVECKRNIVISGGTGSGKTSLLNALSALVPKQERIVVIEDARELQLQGEHVVQLEARPPDPKGKGAVTIRDLFRASLRMRPDRIVLGEIRSGEALDLIQAMTSGHGGCLTTVHATYPKDALSRLETMALMSGVELPLVALRSQLTSAVDIIVQTDRFRDGSRGVTHITEVVGGESEERKLVDLYVRQKGRLVSTGRVPACAQLLESHDFQICQHSSVPQVEAS